MADKTVKEFSKELEELGLVVRHDRNHNKVYTNDDRWVMDFAKSPSDSNWRQSATRRLVQRLQALYQEDPDG